MTTQAAGPINPFGTAATAATTSQATSATPITPAATVGGSAGDYSATQGTTTPTTPTTPVATSNVMSPESLGTTSTAAVVPTYTPPSTNPISQNNSAASQLDQLQAADQQAAQDGPVTTQVSGLTQALTKLLPQDEGKAQALQDAENSAGVNTLTSNLNDINSQIVAEQANQNQSDTDLVANQRNLEGVDQLLPFAQEGQAKLAGDAAILRALSTAKIGVLNARATALQGNISLAMTQAQQAVDAKYAPVEDQIKTYQAQIDALSPLMSSEQQKQAEARTNANTIALQKINNQADTEKSNLAIALQSGANTPYVNNNGQFFNTATGVAYNTPQDFFKAAGVTSFEDAYQKGLITDYTPAKAADYNTVQQMAAKYPDAGIKSTDTPEVATQKLQRSAIYRKETYIAPSGGDTTAAVHDAVQQSIANLQQGFVQANQVGGNGTVNSAAYRAARNTFVSNFAGYLQNPGSTFDDAMSGLVDQSSKTYLNDYGIGDTKGSQ